VRYHCESFLCPSMIISYNYFPCIFGILITIFYILSFPPLNPKVKKKHDAAICEIITSMHFSAKCATAIYPLRFLFRNQESLMRVLLIEAKPLKQQFSADNCVAVSSVWAAASSALLCATALY